MGNRYAQNHPFDNKRQNHIPNFLDYQLSLFF